MPVMIDWMEDEILGSRLRQALEDGRIDGERKVIMALIEERFGPIPESAANRLDSMHLAELDNLVRRVLRAPTLEDLLA